MQRFLGLHTEFSRELHFVGIHAWLFTPGGSKIFLRWRSHWEWEGERFALSAVGSCCPDTGFTPGVNLSVVHPYSPHWIFPGWRIIGCNQYWPWGSFCCLCGFPQYLHEIHTRCEENIPSLLQIHTVCSISTTPESVLCTLGSVEFEESLNSSGSTAMPP